MWTGAELLDKIRRDGSTGDGSTGDADGDGGSGSNGGGGEAGQATNPQTVFKVEARSLLLRGRPSVHMKILRLRNPQMTMRTLKRPSTHTYDTRTYLAAGRSPGRLDERDWGTGSLPSFNWGFASSWACSFEGVAAPGSDFGAWARGASKCFWKRMGTRSVDMGFCDFWFVVICEGWVSISRTVLTYGSHSRFQMTKFLSSVYIWMCLLNTNVDFWSCR